MRARSVAALWLAIAAAGVLHLGLLGSWKPSGPAGRPDGATGQGDPSPTHVTVRWLADHPSALADRPPEATPAAPREPTGTAHPAQPLHAPDTPAPQPQPQAPTPADGVAPHGQVGPDDYLPRSALTVAPQPGGEVLLPYPDGAPLGRYEATLVLFIDEQGRVRHVRPQQIGDLPAALLDSAVQTFLAARFRPGELDGRPVKSRIAVAVEFRADSAPRSVGSP